MCIPRWEHENEHGGPHERERARVEKRKAMEKEFTHGWKNTLPHDSLIGIQKDSGNAMDFTVFFVETLV